MHLTVALQRKVSQYLILNVKYMIHILQCISLQERYTVMKTLLHRNMRKSMNITFLLLAKLSIIEHTTAPNENKTETTKTTVKLKEPNKKNYDLNKFSGIKKYVNDCIKYKAAAEYGITKIIYDDTTHGTVMVGIFLLNTFQTLNIIRSIQILSFRQVLELQLMN